MEGGIMESPETTLSNSEYEDDVALQGCCSPKKRPYRCLGLALMCFLGFGNNPYRLFSLFYLLFRLHVNSIIPFTLFVKQIFYFLSTALLRSKYNSRFNDLITLS